MEGACKEGLGFGGGGRRWCDGGGVERTHPWGRSRARVLVAQGGGKEMENMMNYDLLGLGLEWDWIG